MSSSEAFHGDVLAQSASTSANTRLSAGKSAARKALTAGEGWLVHPLWVVVAIAVWWALAGLSFALASKPTGFTQPLYADQTNIGFALWAAALSIICVIAIRVPAVRTRVLKVSPWLVVLGLFVIVWELATDKFALLPVPFFAPPSSLVEVYVEDWPRLGDSLVNSLRLLAYGFALGAAAGFLTGVLIGWSRSLGYWVHPVLRFLGPIPSTALLPMAFFFFPSSFAAAIFLIALATWFPVTVLTWSGVASVDKAYYDVARTLGADERFLIFKVAIPAALPHVFVGLFMGLGASFSVLVAAEMMGVKSGLGWYLQWAQGWAAYSNMYGALIVMALIFSGLISLLFAIRDRLLAWQKGVVKW